MMSEDETPNVLVDIPENPVPEGTVAGFVTTPDGFRLRHARFVATARPLKGTIIALQGRHETIEKYFETAQDFAARGFQTLTFDWRGQGSSQREMRNTARGYVDSFSSYVTDLVTVFEQIGLPDCRGPFYIVAHSTGGLVALLASPQLVNRVRRMVLCAPLLELGAQPLSRGQINALTGILTTLGLGGAYMGPGPKPFRDKPFVKNKVTSDPARYARNGAIIEAEPRFLLGSPTAAWLAAALRAMDKVWDPDFIASIHIPVLMIAAGSDSVVSTPAIERYAGELRSGAVITIDGAQHEILQESDLVREQFLAAFEAFIPGSETE
jgi:lysophospholipase